MPATKKSSPSPSSSGVKPRKKATAIPPPPKKPIAKLPKKSSSSKPAPKPSGSKSAASKPTRRPILEPTTAADDDVAHQETVRKLRKGVEAQRLNQAVTQKLEEKARLQMLVENGKLSQREADRQLRLKSILIDRRTMEEMDPENHRSAEDSIIHVGTPTSVKRGQLATTIDPYRVKSVKEVGTMPEDKEWTPCKIRFDYNNILAVERIVIPGKPSNGNVDIPYWGWTMKRVKRGDSDEEEKLTKAGNRLKAFGFSGRLISLPELHLALRTVSATETVRGLPTPDLVRQEMREHPEERRLIIDEYGILDLYRYTEKEFDDEPASFGEFRVYIEDSPYKTLTGALCYQKVVTITKRKSEEAIKSAKPNAPEFFLIQIPVRSLPTLIHACACLMKINNMKTLQIPPEILEGRASRRPKPEEAMEQESEPESGDEEDVEEVEEEGEGEEAEEAEEEEEEEDPPYEEEQSAASGSSSDDEDDGEEGDDGGDESDDEDEPAPPPKRTRSAIKRKPPTSPATVDDDDDDDDGDDDEEEAARRPPSKKAKRRLASSGEKKKKTGKK